MSHLKLILVSTYTAVLKNSNYYLDIPDKSLFYSGSSKSNQKNINYDTYEMRNKIQLVKRLRNVIYKIQNVVKKPNHAYLGINL